jgi:hypothetical protein
MPDKKENNRTLVLDSILTLLFLLLVLSLRHDNPENISGVKKQNIPIENTFSQNNAVVCSYNSLRVSQKILATGIKYLQVIKPGQNTIFENRKTRNQISVQKNSISRTENVRTFIYCLHLFPSERDDVPLLS